MSETAKLPRVIWRGRDKKGTEYRLVQALKGHCAPEKRGPDDAMGNESWAMEMWGDRWETILVKEFVELKIAVLDGAENAE